MTLNKEGINQGGRPDGRVDNDREYLTIDRVPDRPGLVQVRSPFPGQSLALYTSRHCYDPEMGKLCCNPVPMAECGLVDSTGTMIGDLFDRALVPAICVVAEQCNWDLKIAPDAKVPSLGSPDLAAAAQTGPVNLELLNLAAEKGLGLVHYHPSVRPAFLFAQLAAAFPNQRLMAIAARGRDCDKIANECDRHGLQVYRADRHRQLPESVPPLIVATPEQATRVDPRQVDLLILTNAREALNARFEVDEYRPMKQTLEVAASVRESGEDSTSPVIPSYRWYCPRRIGFLPDNDFLALSERHRLHRILGFEELTILPDGLMPPRVVVERIKVRRRPNVPSGADALTRLRKGLWWHGDRNRMLCRRARRAVSEGQRVLVLADSLEHAALLSSRLHEWPFRVAMTCPPTGLPSRLRSAVARSNPNATGPQLVATLIAATTLDLASYDVIVRADGGVGLLSGLTGGASVPSDSGRSIILVDCFDEFDAFVKRKSRQRFRAYRDAGWWDAGSIDSDTPKAREFVEEVHFDDRRVDE